MSSPKWQNDKDPPNPEISQLKRQSKFPFKNDKTGKNDDKNSKDKPG